MWAAFKATSWGVKLGMLIAILAAFAAVAAISYNKGLNVSALQISQYQGKIQKLNADLAHKQVVVSEKIVTQYKDRVAYIDKVTYRNRDVVHTNVVPQFKLSKGWIYSYNQSVQGLVVDPVLARDTTPASVSDVDALADTIFPNNAAALANAEQLTQLQQWILATEAARKEVVNEKSK